MALLNKSMNSKLKILTLIFVLIMLVFAGCNKDDFNTLKIKFSDDEIKVKENDLVEIIEDTVVITNAGQYEFTGTGIDKMIYVDCTESVTILLNNMNIINTNQEFIKVSKHSNVTVETTGRQSTIVVQDKSACIKSKGSLNIEGDGKLILRGENGIVTDDVLNIRVSEMEIVSSHDALKADSINISNSISNIKTDKDGIQAKTVNLSGSSIIIEGYGEKSKGINSKDTVNINESIIKIGVNDDGIYADNIISLQSGDITISSADDGIHANKNVTVNGGSILINRCLEGIESGLININGGMIEIHAVNDGLNAAQKDGDEKTDADIHISGGEIIINANGDGVDANGSIYITGGTLFVSGAYGGDNNAIDFDDEFIIDGGVVYAAGNNLKAKPASADSSQNSVMIIFDTPQQENYSIVIYDSSKENIIVYADFFKPYDCAIISVPELRMDQTYYYGVAVMPANQSDYGVGSDTFECEVQKLYNFTILLPSTLTWYEH